MEEFSKHIKHAETLKLLNNCRIFLQIFTLLHITSTDGKRIIKQQLSGYNNPSIKFAFHWPKQTRPSKSVWKICASTVKEVFCKPNSRILKNPQCI